MPGRRQAALIAEAVDLEDITLETVASETYWKLSVVLPHRGGEDTMANQRSGPTDVVDFIFLSTFTRFEEAAPTAWGE